MMEEREIKSFYTSYIEKDAQEKSGTIIGEKLNNLDEILWSFKTIGKIA